jgi:large repetitive protein
MRRHALIIALTLSACGHSLDGPTPAATKVVALVGGDELPPIVCNDPNQTPAVQARLKVTGTAFAPLVEAALKSAHAVLPRITLIDEAGGRHVVPDDSANPDASRVDWVSSTEMQFDFVPGDYAEGLPEGIYDVEIANYQNEGATAPGGQIALLENALAVVPPPVVTATVPDLICTEEADNTIVLSSVRETGARWSGGFLQVGDALPTITVSKGDTTKTYAAVSPLADCEDVGTLAGNDITLQFCQTLSFVVPKADLPPSVDRADPAYTDPVTYAVTVTNPEPAACTSTPSEAVDLTVVPPPSVDTVVPDLICTDEGANTITVNGVDFLSVSDGTTVTLPTVHVGNIDYPTETIDGCDDPLGDPITGPNNPVRRCKTLTIIVPTGAFVPSNNEVTVTNPAPAACTSNTPVNLTVVPPPDLDTIHPAYLCSASGATVLVITATLTNGYGGFLAINATGTVDCTASPAGSCPTLNFDGVPAAFGPDSLGGCDVLPGPPSLTESVQQCTTLTFTLPQGFTPAPYSVTVTNPQAPGSSVPDLCTSDALMLTVADETQPAITALLPDDSACPGLVPAQLTLMGTGFLVVNSVGPTVTFGGNAATVVGAPSGCSALVGPPDIDETVDTCTSITIDVPNFASLAAGTYNVVVTNPAIPSANCLGLASAPFPFVVVDPPTVTSIVPDRVCEDLPMTYTVNGTNFTLQTTVTLTDGVTTYTGTVNPASAIPNQLTVDFGALLNPGTYDLTVSNGPGCEDTLVAALIVEPTPFVFFVDPPIVFNGISTQVTIYVTNINCLQPGDPGYTGVPLTDCIGSISIAPTGGGTPIDLTASASYDLSRPNRVQAAVPSLALGGPAAGSYDVLLTDGLGCVAAPLTGGLNVTDNVAINLTSIDPTFGQTATNTPVAINTDGFGGTSFLATPRVYLNPTGGGTTAAAVSAVAWVNANQVTGIAPAGPPPLPPGDYDVIVVNPDTGVGLPAVGVSSQPIVGSGTTPFTFKVTAAPPPTISSLTPGSIPASTGQVVQVVGDHFDNPCPGTCPGVVLTCRDPAGVITVLSGGTPQLSVDSSTQTTINITVDGTALVAGTVCLVRVTNADGSFGDFSALGVTTPAGNITDFGAGTAMNTARRAPAVVAGRVTNAARFLYAIGGDDGTTAGAYDTFEAASVSTLGVLSAWRTLPGTLPAPRTLAGAAALDHAGRRFVYVVGGDEGAGAVDTVIRAEVLDPTRTPEIVNLDFTPDTAVAFVGPGVLPGNWNYKVAATFDPADPENPGGESLPGDVQPVTVPASPSVDVTIEWTSVPNATGYRIYRSPMPNQGTGTELLLATVVGGGTTSYVDTGTDNSGATETPHRIGDLGNWAAVGNLNTPREGAGVAIATDPDTADAFFLYAVGGLDDTGTVLDSYEYAAITVNPADGTQAVGAFAEDATNVLATPRWQLSANAVDHAAASRVAAPDTWIYAGDGCTTAAPCNATSDVDAALVLGDGSLVQADRTTPGWTAVDTNTPTRAGYGNVGANNRLFTFGGVNGAPANNSRSAEICDPSIGACGGNGPPDLVNWNADPANMVCARYLMGSALESATIFLVGGAADTAATPACGTNPTATTEGTAW